MAKAVFFDPDRKRWKRIRTLLDVLGACITVVIIVFLISVSQSYTLPSLLFEGTKRPYRHIRQEPAKPKPVVHKNKVVNKVKSIPTGPLDESWRAAFFVTWDAGAFASFREYHQQIDALFPEWLHVVSTDGKIKGLTPDYKLFDVVSGGRIHSPDDKVMPFLKKEGGGTDVFPLVNNYDPVAKVWLTSVGGFLKNSDSRLSFRAQVLAFLLSDDFKGLSIDFEEIPLDAQPGFLALVTELYTEFHPRGLKLFVNVPTDDKDYDYTALANNADGLILMDYDEHQNSGRPGPVASQEYFIKNLGDTLKMVPKEKLICAIGNYGYDWTSVQTRKGDVGKIVAVRSVSVQEAWLAAAESEESVVMDPDSLNPHIAFLEENNLRHDIWFLNGVTALNQMRGANRLGVNKFALWRLGAEDRSIWPVWDNPSESGAETKLSDVPPGQDVDLEGQGEVLHIQQFPKNGVREVKLDQETGLIVDSNLKVIPLPYQIFQYGAKKKQIAITFDDGPDPTFTPQILDILKQENAPAVFFLIGIQAEKYASITRRIFREGHEIGNHTFTHPDISAIGRRHMELELNLTERFLASELGIKPLYFRPPYSIDQEPDTADQVRPLEIVQSQGYITVGDKIDPNDWHDDPAKPAEAITNDVIEQLQKGNIILLHDGGGNRTETVKALPMIIHALRERGYEIVPVSTLIGKTRAGVMPSITPEEQLFAQINRVAFTIFALLNSFIVLVFFVGDFLMSGRLLLVGFGAVLERFLSRHVVVGSGGAYQPTVAVLIPAYNEEKVIERTVRSALASDYPNVKVVVVDDGSTDQTHEIAMKAFAAEIRNGKLILLTKDNSGKASAANYGLQHIDEEIFVAIDADTVIAPDAISRMVPHFRDEKVGALAGNAKVGNRVNIWTRWQALEYITSQNFERRALDLIGAVSVVPGAIGAWRTSAVREVGNYPYDTVAEDADLTMSLLQAGYRVHYEDRALAYTEAPRTARGLMRQRFRWSFGVLQAVWKHRAAFWRGGSLGWVGLPNILIFQMLLPLVSPFIDVMFLVGVVSYGFNRYFHPDTTNPADLTRLLLFFSLFLVIDFAASALAFLLERKEARMPDDKWLLLQVWLQRFAYRQLFSLVLFRTLKRAFDGRPFSWDKIERSAALTHGRPIAS